MDDANLVAQVLQGNMGAYTELVRRYTAQIGAQCRAHIHRADVVEDVVQETFCCGLDNLVNLSKPESFGAWLYSIARSLCRDRLNDPNNPHFPLPVQEREVIEIYYGGDRINYKQLAERLRRLPREKP